MNVTATAFNPTYATRALAAARPQASSSPQIEDTLSLSTGLAKSPGQKQALQFAGIGVMFGGMIASTNLPPGWVGVGIIGSMCAGLALMALARD